MSAAVALTLCARADTEYPVTFEDGLDFQWQNGAEVRTARDSSVSCSRIDVFRSLILILKTFALRVSVLV